MPFPHSTLELREAGRLMPFPIVDKKTILDMTPDEIAERIEARPDIDYSALLVDMFPAKLAAKILNSMSIDKAVSILDNANLSVDKAASILDSTDLSVDKVASILLDPNLSLSRARSIFDMLTRSFPGYTVADNWDDTSLVYDSPSGAVVELDSPATGYKRVFESSDTYGYTPGFRVIPDGVLQTGRILVKGEIGAYHGYNATRAIWRLIVFLPDKSEYVQVAINFADNGFANGSYNNRIVIALQINPDNTVSVDAGGLAYTISKSANPYSMVGQTVVVACAYYDAWSADYNQWSSLNAEAVILR